MAGALTTLCCCKSPALIWGPAFIRSLTIITFAPIQRYSNLSAVWVNFCLHSPPQDTTRQTSHRAFLYPSLVFIARDGAGRRCPGSLGFNIRRAETVAEMPRARLFTRTIFIGLYAQRSFTSQRIAVYAARERNERASKYDGIIYAAACINDAGARLSMTHDVTSHWHKMFHSI